MVRIRAAAARPIAAPAEQVYRYIADFREHHPRWLPPAFSDFQVEQGGVGAGTVASFRLTLGGRSQRFRTRVQEPAPGHVLTESDAEAGTVTTFMVTPDGEHCQVRIETVWQASGLRGLVDRLLAPWVLRRLYSDELARLDRYAREQARG